MGESAQGAGQRKKEEAPRLPGREMTSMNQQAQRLALGIDIGSTTAKVVLLEDGRVIFEQYQRHFSQVRQKTLELLEEAAPYIKDRPFTAAISGSAGLGLAQGAGVPFVQEVFATGEVVERLEPDASAVIELGGEDAKIIFFDGGIDERMNGSCAGGTGAFIDQMATLLNVTVDELDKMSLESTRLYPIASRCGVFAKTDIQPLLNQGAKHADVAASIYQAVVNQTIAGLAQGRRIAGKVLFLGGPLYYCKGLRRRFQETLGLTDEQAVFPEYGRFAVALGAALYGTSSGGTYTVAELRATCCRRCSPPRRTTRRSGPATPPPTSPAGTSVHTRGTPGWASTAAAPPPSWPSSAGTRSCSTPTTPPTGATRCRSSRSSWRPSTACAGTGSRSGAAPSPATGRS